MIKAIKVPDIGDFDAVEIIEVLVAPGEVIAKEQALVTLESDKATMDIPSPESGTVKAVIVSTGQKVAQGDVILQLETGLNTEPATSDERAQDLAEDNAAATPTASAPVAKDDKQYDADVIVVGAGPGGYTAAFRAADLGLKTILIERYPTLGGVCLNVGCIPSKALLHVGRVQAEIDNLKAHGIDLAAKQPKPKPVRSFAESVIDKLTSGLATMAKQRKVEVVQGSAAFTSVHSIAIKQGRKIQKLSFAHAIIAVGSQAIKLPFLPADPRIMDSTAALLLKKIPQRMLVIGGGIIGLEMATIYAALGCKITIVETLPALMAACDSDIVRPLQKKMKHCCENIYLETAVTAVTANKKGLTVDFKGAAAPEQDQFDAILVAVGRSPNGNNIAADKAGVHVDTHGFIAVNAQQQTNIEHIFAIGDVTGQPMLAHKATHEGKIAAETIAGNKVGFDNRVIPSVAYTDPEVAWVGLSEATAKAQGIDYGKGVFPWAASGRALAMGRDEGLTKLLFEKQTHRILGAAIVGPNAGDLIAECALAIEMGADAEDIGLTIHPHPTVSETVALAAEAFSGTITDLYMPKR